MFIEDHWSYDLSNESLLMFTANSVAYLAGSVVNTLSPMGEYSRHYVFLYKPNHVHARPAFDVILQENQSQHSIGVVRDDSGGCDLSCVKFSPL